MDAVEKYSEENLKLTVRELNLRTDELFEVQEVHPDWYVVTIDSEEITQNDLFNVINRLYQIAREHGIIYDLV